MKHTIYAKRYEAIILSTIIRINVSSYIKVKVIIYKMQQSIINDIPKNLLI